MQTVAPSDSKGSCKRTQHSQKCWMLHAAFVCTTHRMLLHVFCVLLLSCCAKFETGQTFKKATPNIVLLSPKRSAIMLVLTLFGVVASVCTIPHVNTDATVPNIFARSLTLRKKKLLLASQRICWAKYLSVNFDKETKVTDILTFDLCRKWKRQKMRQRREQNPWQSRSWKRSELGRISNNPYPMIRMMND